MNWYFSSFQSRYEEGSGHVLSNAATLLPKPVIWLTDWWWWWFNNKEKPRWLEWMPCLYYVSSTFGLVCSNKYLFFILSSFRLNRYFYPQETLANFNKYPLCLFSVYPLCLLPHSKSKSFFWPFEFDLIILLFHFTIPTFEILQRIKEK